MSLVKYNEKRDFKQTSEPKSGKKKGKDHIFVVQRHHATRLHYDFRLEMDGVLKSWAVPKGPSLNPEDKRLAMEVEDHPYDYKDFEGEIPPGNYGAGYVYLWDKGTYELLDDKGNDFDKQALKEWKSGSVKVVLHGKKLKGEFALVKMHGRGENAWLMIKHRDRYAKDEYNSEDHTPQRVKDKLKGEANNKKAELKAGPKKAAVPAKKAAAKKSASPKKTAAKTAASPKKAAAKSAASSKKAATAKSVTSSKKAASKKNAGSEKIKEFYKPMLTTLVDEPFEREGWVFENKWDGYRMIANVVDGKASLYSRHQLSFNELYTPIVESVEKIPHNVVLDGEVIVLGTKGRSDFQALQNYKTTRKGKLVYEVFDLLHLDGHDLMDLTLLERKALLEELLKQQKDPAIQYSKHVTGGLKLFNKAADEGWEGIIAKDGESNYVEGARSMSWLKIKVLNRQETVICGYTEPRGSRKEMGALILGVYEDGKLSYIGHCGGGFNTQSLKEMYQRLQPYRQTTSPFDKRIKTNTPVNWVKPELVCEVKFSGWTGEGILRQPIFVAMREDKPAKEVKRELPKHLNMGTTGKEKKSVAAARAKAEKEDLEDVGTSSKKAAAPAKRKVATSSKTVSGKASTAKEATTSKGTAKRAVAKKTSTSKASAKKATTGKASPAKTSVSKTPATKKVTSKAATGKASSTEKERTLKLNNQTVTLTNQQKIYWPKEKITKGELIDYYMSVADTILPYLKDRPLSLNRYPNGIDGPSFYHKDIDVEKSPAWLKTTPVMAESTGKQVDYLICNNQATLAYMINLGCIEVNPWLSRISKPEYPDYVVIDLDPEDIAFTHVVETANVVRGILEGYDLTSFVKTSGATGMHIYIPTGGKYDFDTCKLFAEFIAQQANVQLPDTTSIVRAKAARKKRVYIDFLQNRRGQTIAAPYSARPKPGATVSTPLEWKEVNKRLNIKDFHIGNTVSRLEKAGDLWKDILKTKNNLQSILKNQAI